MRIAARLSAVLLGCSALAGCVDPGGPYGGGYAGPPGPVYAAPDYGPGPVLVPGVVVERGYGRRDDYYARQRFERERIDRDRYARERYARDRVQQDRQRERVQERQQVRENRQPPRQEYRAPPQQRQQRAPELGFNPSAADRNLP